MIKMGSDVEIVLRDSVVQMEHVAENKLCKELLFSLVLYCIVFFFNQKNKQTPMYKILFFFSSASTQRKSFVRKCSLL